MKPYVDAAAERERGQWGLPPGFGAFVNQLGVTAGTAFILGLLSFLRRERLWWVAAIPAVPGGLFAGWMVFVTLWNSNQSGIRAIRRSPVLMAGVVMVLIGVFFLARLLPRVRARLARELEADDLGETNTRTKLKAVKLFGIATLIAGIGFILIHVFNFF